MSQKMSKIPQLSKKRRKATKTSRIWRARRRRSTKTKSRTKLLYRSSIRKLRPARSSSSFRRAKPSSTVPAAMSQSICRLVTSGLSRIYTKFGRKESRKIWRKGTSECKSWNKNANKNAGNRSSSDFKKSWKKPWNRSNQRRQAQPK